MEKRNLTDLLSTTLYAIPDYQRGYAWDNKQWKDFAEDIDALIDEDIRHHYTGTIVTYTDAKKEPQHYGPKQLQSADIVDGQQRLTTSILYLSIILNQLVARGLTDYEDEKADYLYKGATTRLRLNNDTQDIFYDLISQGRSNTAPQSQHQQRLIDAHGFFTQHLNEIPETDKETRLKKLYHAVTSKLVFTYYPIEEECEIGMTFELMNSRGKDLSTLELLKNYFMHWVYRNLQKIPAESESLTELINKRWKATYLNIGSVDGDEDQALRVAWILMCSPTPKNWKGYQGFKEPAYFPIRKFENAKTTREEVQSKMGQFIDLLANISSHYAAIKRPAQESELCESETKWLQKLNNGGNLANFLPLLIAARSGCAEGKIQQVTYLDLIRTLETFLYRVFLFEGKRSNAGKSRLYGMANELYLDPSKLGDFIDELQGLINYYSSSESFIEQLDKPDAWYHWGRLLKYTLYEYELKLLKDRTSPKLTWSEICESTLEHILPQTPEKDSIWLKEWQPDEIESYQHDIGNMCLTFDNSRYLNFEYERKKGEAGAGYCYANSDIHQEREIASYGTWTAQTVQDRREKLVEWIKERWATKTKSIVPQTTSDTEDEDITET